MPQCALIPCFAIRNDVLCHLSHAACFLYRDGVPTSAVMRTEAHKHVCVRAEIHWKTEHTY